MRLPARRRLRAPTVVGRRVWDHWTGDRGTLRQGFTALGLSTAVGLAAGLVLGAMTGVLADVPGLLVLVPAAIGIRGSIFGALGSRLGTGMLTGELTPALNRTSFTGQNIEAAAVLTLSSSAFAALAARATAAAFGEPTVSLWELMVVSMVGGLLASVFLLAGVLALARVATLRSWDMDAVAAPLITATGDVVTLPSLVVATLLLGHRIVTTGLGVALFALACAALVLGVTRSPQLAQRIMRQSLPVLGYAVMMQIIAGTVLETRLESFVALAALLVLVPPFIATCGSLGGILSARLASQLHLGLVEPRIVPEERAWLETSNTALFAVVAFAVVGAAAHVLSVLSGYRSPGLAPMIAIALLGGVIATVVLIAVAYSVAAATFHLGWDPDNYGIPIVTATMDFLGVLCLVLAIAAVGVS